MSSSRQRVRAAWLRVPADEDQDGGGVQRLHQPRHRVQGLQQPRLRPQHHPQHRLQLRRQVRRSR